MNIIYIGEMSQIRWNRCLMWFLFVSGLAVTSCYPTGKPQYRTLREDKQVSGGTAVGKPEASQESDLRDEKQFPNGTVVGKYTYLDNDGNPIQVKYYADESSYGVELKSIKVLDPNFKRAELSQTIDYPKEDPLKELTPHLPDPKSLPSLPTYNTVYLSGSKSKPSNSLQYLDKESTKFNRYKADKSTPDFEVYYQNELKGPKKCGKEKVRVYYDKERKIRNAIDSFDSDADKYCEQF